LRDIKEVYAPEGYLLTAAVAATETSSNLSYDIPGMVPHLDFVNVMTYDMHGAWNPFTGNHAPLFEGPGDKHKEWNVDACVQFWYDFLAEILVFNSKVLKVHNSNFPLKNYRKYYRGILACFQFFGGKFPYFSFSTLLSEN
jgi:GH18 family chitinase